MTEDEIESLFNDVAMDPDTRSLAVSYVLFAGRLARMELWSWEGITGSTVVFRTSDIESLTDDELMQLVRDEIGADGAMTVKRAERFIFINHSFR